MSFTGQNINRVNAVKKIQKGLRLEDHNMLLAALANAFIFVGDMIQENNELRESLEEHEEEHQ